MDFESGSAGRRRQDELLITSVVLVVLSGLIVVMRCLSRFILIRNPGSDDFLMIGALVLTIAYLVNLFIGKSYHFGFPMQMLSLDDMVNIMKGTLVIECLYYGIIFCVKTSICFTYLRFALSKTFRWLCIGTIVLHSVFFAVCITVTLLQCQPLHKMWDLTGMIQGKCINSTAFFYSTSGFNIVTDIWILLIPVPTLRAINRPGREKVALMLIFGVGALATAASIARLHTIVQYTEAADPFRDALNINLWSMIEATIAISCASVSALKPVFSRRLRARTRIAAGSSGISRQQQQQHPSSTGFFFRKHRDPSCHTGGSSQGGDGADEPFPQTTRLPQPGSNGAAAKLRGSSGSDDNFRVYGFARSQENFMAGGGSGGGGVTPLRPRPDQSMKGPDSMELRRPRPAQIPLEWNSSDSVLIIQQNKS